MKNFVLRVKRASSKGNFKQDKKQTHAVALENFT